MLPQAFIFFISLNSAFSASDGVSFQAGKLNISQALQSWSCSSECSPSQHCRLPRCTKVSFPTTFSGQGKVQVHVSLSHGDEFSHVHSPAALWVQSISPRGFDVCARETGSGTNETAIINWLAFQDHPQLIHGRVAFSGVWTTQTKCNKVTFSQSFGGKPSVFATVKYNRITKPNDAVYLWLENINAKNFKVCIREFLPFDGKHQDTIVDWFAFMDSAQVFNVTLAGRLDFPNRDTPSEDDNFGFCERVQFNTTFYASPVVLVSVDHHYERQIKGNILPENNIITVWIEDIGLTSMQICVQDLSGSGSNHDPLNVSYLVFGDLDPCMNVHCPSFGVCKTFSAHEARCVCSEDCPSIEDPVCTSNGTTYDNKCLYELSYCRGLENNTVYHPGSCEGFPFLRGRVEVLKVPKWSDSGCQTVVFPPYSLYPDKEVHIQITVNHMRLNDSVTVHEAVTSWTEKVNTKNFTVCATQSGRKGKNFNPFASVDWIAYQGAPSEGITGKIKMRKWWSGTNCANLTFPKDKFEEMPVVLVTAEHQRTGKEYDASLIWTEDVSKISSKVCLRELQNFDGKHEDIDVNWLAFSELHKPFFTEHGFVRFPNSNPPTDENNNAYCEFINFTRKYDASPTVLIVANHSTSESGNVAPVHNGISAWIENKDTSGFRVCVKELYATRYDPLSVSYVVFTDICDPGWSYFRGFCYLTSDKCANWTTALSKCRQMTSVLVDVNSNEENVYIQHRHNGKKTWLGFNDVLSEGVFTWADLGAGNFTAWAKDQPNNYGEQDCAHTLGVKHSYEWNDVSCGDCHQYTCKKDLNECVRQQYYCHKFATCKNTRGSYSCKCNQGYTGDGFECYNYAAGLTSSNIVGTKNQYLMALNNWLKPVVPSKRHYWKRCYLASSSDWASTTFHALCDNKGPTVTIVQVGEYVFGGYTKVSWAYSCAYRYDAAAFLFSLRNKPGWGPTLLPQTGRYSSSKSHSIYSCSGYGVTFGGGHDFYISTYASTTTSSYSNLGYTYSPPAGHSYNSAFAKSFLAGSYNFKPTEVEVFYLTT